MLKRRVCIALLCALALSIASVVVAQESPQPVVRMGDWVEIGDDVWMNIIASNTIRFRSTSNVDFDSDVQDLAGSSSVTSSSCQESSCDALAWETRLGADFRYRKNLTMRVLYEQQNVMDGNLIDGGGEADVAIERAWVDYKFPNTSLRMRVGAHLWRFDPLSWVGDDDPGFHLWYNLGPNDEVELYAAAIIQQEGQRLGLTNDNDNAYYLFKAAYNAGSHRFSLNLIGQRDRFCNDCVTFDNTQNRQKTDVIYITPAWEGRVGIFKFVAQGSVVFGEVDRGPAPGEELDIFAVAGQIAVEANLGKIVPFFTFVYGSGDDNPFDDELNAYATLAHKDITLTGSSPLLGTLTNSTLFSGIEQGPTFARAFGLNGRLQSGDNIFNNGLGFHQSYDIRGQYAGPGTIIPAIGVKVFPVKNWEIAAHWAGNWVIETEPLEVQLNQADALGRTADIDNFIWHEFGAMVTWTVNKHFDLRARGIVALPGDGAEDIAAMTDPANCGRTSTETCDGDDPMLVGQLQVRGRF